jgi:hypothetical protein
MSLTRYKPHDVPFHAGKKAADGRSRELLVVVGTRNPAVTTFCEAPARDFLAPAFGPTAYRGRAERSKKVVGIVLQDHGCFASGQK